MTSPTNDTPNISPAACALLATAVVAGTILAGLVAAQAVTDIKVYVGTSGFLAAVAAIAGVGFIVQNAAERILRRVDQVEAKLDEERERGYASGYVDGAAGNRRHLTAVGDA